MKIINSNRWISWKRSLIIGIVAFFLAVIAGFASQVLLSQLTSVIIAFILLLMIILVGVLFDIIGVAAAASNEEPFHARAAKKIFGAQQAIMLVRNADRVASFCSDVIGDIAGTLSGAVGVAIIFQLILNRAGEQQIIAGTLVTALVAALTVFGKAYGKTFAISKSEKIIFQVGVLLAWLEKYFRFTIFKPHRKEKPM